MLLKGRHLVLNCCVGFASPVLFSEESNECAWNFAVAEFLISVHMFIMSKVFLIWSATVIFSRMGSHLFEPPCYGVV